MHLYLYLVPTKCPIEMTDQSPLGQQPEGPEPVKDDDGETVGYVVDTPEITRIVDAPTDKEIFNEIPADEVRTTHYCHINGCNEI